MIFQKRQEEKKGLSGCSIIIFGATGDLSKRKLLPALYNLALEKLLPPNFFCTAFARKEKNTPTYRAESKNYVSEFSRLKPLDQTIWKDFESKLFYHQANFDEDMGYDALREMLEVQESTFKTGGNRIFYLATPPKYFPLIIEKLHRCKLLYPYKENSPFSRIIIEKPFGRDLESAVRLQNHILNFLSEEQIYRIDHYLGKETVQNLLVFRFANSIFESLWNSNHVDHVQITVAEDLGIGSRAAFFEEAGMLRDIVQNHVMQLLSLIAMEPPSSLAADSIRDEKVKVLNCIRAFEKCDFSPCAIRGQYGDGKIKEKDVLSYRKEKNVNLTSNTETFVALKMFIDNWRWAGIPFYIRAGKRLPKRMTEIAVFFKRAPGVLFQKDSSHSEPNILALRIQPDEGIYMKFNSKLPGQTTTIHPVKMEFLYSHYFKKNPPDAYERLIMDCILGDRSLFARGDEVLNSWRIFTPLLKFWEENEPKNFPNYPAGSWGPHDAEKLLLNEKREWQVF